MTFILSTAGIGSSRRDQAMATAAECKYLWEIPKRHEIRQGQVLVHNSERPTWRLGMHEFRAWLQAPGPDIEPWAAVGRPSWASITDTGGRSPLARSQLLRKGSPAQLALPEPIPN